jgi:hypothetical protein
VTADLVVAAVALEVVVASGTAEDVVMHGARDPLYVRTDVVAFPGHAVVGLTVD